MNKLTEAQIEETFNSAVNKWLEDYKKSTLSLTPEEIWSNAYSIAKAQSIVGFLQASVSIEEKAICINHVDTIVNDLIEDEYDYDVGMWDNWDDLEQVFEERLEKYKKQDADNGGAI